MDTGSEIKKALKEALGINPNLPITATIVSIENETCTIKLLSELVLSDVRLKATVTDEADMFLIVPKIGSEVIVMSQTGELSGLMVIKVDNVEKIIYKQGDFEFIVDSSDKKVVIKNGDANVYTAFQLLSDLLKQFQVYTSNGPSGTPLPNTITSINKFETEFKGILKAN